MSTAPKTVSLNYTSNFFLESCVLTRKGRHKDCSEDSTLEMCEQGIFGVADGTGGSEGGRIASEEVINSIRERVSNISFENEIKVMAAINEAIVRAKVKIQQFSRKKGLENVGTTIVILRLNVENNSAYIMHAGDSRVYRLRNGGLVQLTRDHVHESDTSEHSDTRTTDEKTNLTRAIGLYDKINLETTTIELQFDDIFLLCSGGLHKHLDNTQISKILNNSANKGIKHAANELIDNVEQAGCDDDVSLILVKVAGESGTEGAESRETFNPRLWMGLGGLLLVVCLWLAFNAWKPRIPENLDTSERTPSAETVSNTGQVSTNNQLQVEIDESTIDVGDANKKGSNDESRQPSLAMTTDPSKAQSVDSPSGTNVKNLDSMRSAASAVDITTFLSFVKDNLVNWNTLPIGEKRKQKVSLLKGLNDICRHTNQNRFDNGDEVRKVFDELLLLNDSSLQRAVRQRRKIFESDFQSALSQSLASAKQSCEWGEIRQLLSKNKEVSAEFANAAEISYAIAWSELVGPLQNGSEDLLSYVQQTREIVNRVQLLSEAGEPLETEIKTIAKVQDLSSVELCRQLLALSGKLRETLVSVSNRLASNLLIFDIDDVERLLNVTYPDDKTLRTHRSTLVTFKATLDQVMTVRNSLNRVDEWIPPAIEVAEFDNWSLELIKLSRNVRDYLLFISRVFRDYQKVVGRPGNVLFNDLSLITAYDAELKKIDSILPTEVARYLRERFQAAFQRNP